MGEKVDLLQVVACFSSEKNVKTQLLRESIENKKIQPATEKWMKEEWLKFMFSLFSRKFFSEIATKQGSLLENYKNTHNTFKNESKKGNKISKGCITVLCFVSMAE